jgi:hypothetical protein
MLTWLKYLKYLPRLTHQLIKYHIKDWITPIIQLIAPYNRLVSRRIRKSPRFMLFYPATYIQRIHN